MGSGPPFPLKAISKTQNETNARVADHGNNYSN